MSYSQFFSSSSGQYLAQVTGMASPCSASYAPSTSNLTYGYSNLSSITTASGNTAIGGSCLDLIVSGDSNVAVGSSAGQYAAAASTGCTFLGAGTTPPDTDTNDYTNLSLIGAGAVPFVEGLDNQMVLGALGTTVIVPSSSFFCIPSVVNALSTATSVPLGSICLYIPANGQAGYGATYLAVNVQQAANTAPTWQVVQLGDIP